MHRKSLVAVAVIGGLLGLVACNSESVVRPQLREVDAHAALLPIDVLGSNHVPPGQACRAAGYHDFDFWIGQWDVRGPAGGLAGTNVVKSRVGGCVVEENWVGNGGGFGRSLNAYDAASGKWSQMWVGSNGCANNVIIIDDGSAENGVMTIRGRKEQPNGYLFGPPCFAPPGVMSFARNNLIRWTLLPSGSVLQQFTASNNDNPLLDPPPASTGIGLRYDKVAAVTPLNPPDPSLCPSTPQARHFDFMLGTWDIHEGNGNGSQATATYTADMHGCLVEELLTGRAGYEGLSFSSYDVYTATWRRTFVDSDGVRLMLEGTLANGSMVLTGKKQGQEGSRVRVSWIPEGANRVVQRWEVSRDGADWSNAKELVYTRQ